jgi:hypothetical protein
VEQKPEKPKVAIKRSPDRLAPGGRSLVKPPAAPKPEPHEVAAKALTDIIAVLGQLPDDDRERVLKSAQAYFSPLAKKEWER